VLIPRAPLCLQDKQQQQQQQQVVMTAKQPAARSSRADWQTLAQQVACHELVRQLQVHLLLLQGLQLRRLLPYRVASQQQAAAARCHHQGALQESQQQQQQQQMRTGCCWTPHEAQQQPKQQQQQLQQPAPEKMTVTRLMTLSCWVAAAWVCQGVMVRAAVRTQ
jgi:ribosomal protein L22